MTDHSVTLNSLSGEGMKKKTEIQLIFFEKIWLKIKWKISDM